MYLRLLATLLLVALLSRPAFGLAEANSFGLMGADDYILLIDNSGSVLRADPENERFSAAEDFIGTLDGDRQVRVEVFTYETEGSCPLSPVSDALRAEISELFSQCAAADEDKGTDIQMALEQVIVSYEQTERSAAVLLFSDGTSDMELDSLIQVYTAAGIPIYCIGISDGQESDGQESEVLASEERVSDEQESEAQVSDGQESEAQVSDGQESEEQSSDAQAAELQTSGIRQLQALADGTGGRYMSLGELAALIAAAEGQADEG